MRTCVATEESSFAQAREHLPTPFTLGHIEKGPCLSKPDEMKEMNDDRRNGPRALAFHVSACPTSSQAELSASFIIFKP